MEKKRELYPDLLRIAAAFAVILLHTAASNWSNADVFHLRWQVFNAYDSIVRWCVPVFIMISGVFLLDGSKKITYKSIYTRYIPRIIIPLVFWGIFYMFLTQVTSHKQINIDFLSSSFIALVTGKTTTHLWYLYMLIGLYIITPFLRILVNNASKRDLEYYLLISFLFAGLLPELFLMKPLSIFKDIVNKLMLSSVLGYTGIYVMGYYFGKYDVSRKTAACFYSLGGLSAIFTIAASTVIALHLKKPSQALFPYLYPNVLFMAIALFLFFKRVVSTVSLSQKARGIITAVAECAFGIYLVHMAVLKMILLVGFTTLSINAVFSVPLISVTAFLLSLGIVWVIRQIPFAGKQITQHESPPRAFFAFRAGLSMKTLRLTSSWSALPLPIQWPSAMTSRPPVLSPLGLSPPASS